MIVEELQKVWSELIAEAVPKPQSGMTRRRIARDSKVKLFLAITWPTENRAIIVEGTKSGGNEKIKSPSTKGIKVQVSDVPGVTEGCLCLFLVLEEKAHEDLFATFAASLTEQLSRVADEEAAFREALDYLARWKRMMEGGGGKGLSPEKQRGLLGELVFLKERMIGPVSATDAVFSWHGPSGSHQDFICAETAVEVKTTITKRHSVLKINSEKQLDEKPHQYLFLAHIRLDEGSAGISLAETVEAVRRLMVKEPLALAEFSLRLREGGYEDGANSDYTDKKYVISNPVIYRVQGNFPRLTEKDLPPGVGDIKYTIVADALSSYLTDGDKFGEVLGGVNG
ncbi:PD-(D/E)XK motif protein [Thalassospira sp. SM2505]